MRTAMVFIDRIACVPAFDFYDLDHEGDRALSGDRKLNGLVGVRPDTARVQFPFIG